jgi:hypothetical protein
MVFKCGEKGLHLFIIYLFCDCDICPAKFISLAYLKHQNKGGRLFYEWTLIISVN